MANIPFFRRSIFFFLLIWVLSLATGVCAQSSPMPADTVVINRELGRAKTLAQTNKDSARRLLYQLSVKSLELHYIPGLVNTQIQLGNVYANEGAFDSALYTYNNGLKVCDTSKVVLAKLSTLYNNIAGIYQFKGNYDQAVKYYQLAIDAGERYTSALSLAQIYNNIAVVFNQNEQYSKALYYLDKGEAVAAKENQPLLLGAILTNKGIVYGSQKNWDKAKASFTGALDIGIKYNAPDQIQAANTNLGTIYLRRGNPRIAIAYLEKALAAKDGTNPYYINAAVTSLGKAYLNLHNYHMAERYLLRSLATAQKSSIGRDLVAAHKALAGLYEATGQYKLAFEHEQQYEVIQDSQMNKEKQKLMNELEIKYRTAQKDREIAQKQLQIKGQERTLEKKNLWIGIIASVIIVLAVILVGVQRSYDHKQRLQQKQIQILQQQQEISELKAIMNGEEKERTRIARALHDGIMVQFSAVRMNLNTLINNPEGLQKKEQLQQVLTQVDGAVTELRSTAHNLMPDMLLEEGLVEAVFYFCNNLQQTIDLKIDFQHYGDFPQLDPEFALSVYRIIQELVQNILKHAQATAAIIQLSCKDDLLAIVVEDDGCGISDAALRGNKGMGIKSIRARVHAMNGHMELESLAGTGTTLQLEFNIRNRIISKK